MSKNIQGNFKDIQGLFYDKTTYFETQGLFKDNLKIQGLFKGCANHGIQSELNKIKSFHILSCDELAQVYAPRASCFVLELVQTA